MDGAPRRRDAAAQEFARGGQTTLEESVRGIGGIDGMRRRDGAIDKACAALLPDGYRFACKRVLMPVVRKPSRVMRGLVVQRWTWPIEFDGQGSLFAVALAPARP